MPALAPAVPPAFPPPPDAASAAPASAAPASPDASRASEATWLAAAFAPDALGAGYQFVRVLGRGGMGVVVLARERALHRAVAVKLLRPDLARSPSAAERFRREARIQAQLEHPGIVPLHAAGGFEPGPDGAPPAPYLVLRHVAGGSLADRLAGGALPADEVRRVLAEVAGALAYAHAQGIVHRDLKPENVLLELGAGERSAGEPSGVGRAMLTDFGVAARPSHDDPRTADHGAGTPRYMAPEQVAGEHAVDGRTDLYALGAMGLVMLTGRRPFPEFATAAVPAAHVAAPVPDVAALAPGAPRDLCAALARCLAKDPAERWQSAAAFADAIARPAARPGFRPWRRWRHRAGTLVARLAGPAPR